MMRDAGRSAEGGSGPSPGLVGGTPAPLEPPQPREEPTQTGQTLSLSPNSVTHASSYSLDECCRPFRFTLFWRG